MQTDSNIKLILHKLKHIYSEINPDFYQTNRPIPNNTQSHLTYILALLEEFQHYVNHAFDQRYRPIDEYLSLETTLQNKEAEIRNYIRIQQCMVIKEENLQQKIESVQKSNEKYQLQCETLKKQMEKLKMQIEKEKSSQEERILTQRNQKEKVPETKKYSNYLRKYEKIKTIVKNKEQYQTNTSISVGKSDKNILKKNWI